MNQTPAERAREIVENLCDHILNVQKCRAAFSEAMQKPGQVDSSACDAAEYSLCSFVAQHASIITAALTIPANHIRTHEGKDVKVLGTLIYTEDGCLCGNGAKVYPLHPLPDYPDDHGRIEFRLVDDASGEQYDESEASPGKCFSSRDAAKAALTAESGTEGEE